MIDNYLLSNKYTVINLQLKLIFIQIAIILYIFPLTLPKMILHESKCWQVHTDLAVQYLTHNFSYISGKSNDFLSVASPIWHRFLFRIFEFPPKISKEEFFLYIGTKCVLLKKKKIPTRYFWSKKDTKLTAMTYTETLSNAFRIYDDNLRYFPKLVNLLLNISRKKSLKYSLHWLYDKISLSNLQTDIVQT